MHENAKMHYCMRSIFYVPEETHYCMCSIFHVPEEIHHRICPILTYARRIALLHALDILCARRNTLLHGLDMSCARGNTSSHMPNIDLWSKNHIIACARYYIVLEEVHHCIMLDIACARRNALSHCAWDFIVPEVCISSRLHRARSLHVPESNQVISINRCQKQIRSLLITDIPKASSSKGIIFHSLRTSCHGLRTYFMHIMFLRRHSLKASSSWPADIISWPKGLISSYHNPKVS